MMDKINLIPLNLSQVPACKRKLVRFQDWDEENRLRMVVGSEYCGFYGYDANGERVYKLSGKSSLEYVDTHETRADVLFDNITLYPNPYVTITPNHYTKHYYANNERFATVIGGGGFGEMVHNVITPIQNQHEFDLCRYSFEHYSNFYPFEYHWETYPVTEHNIDINNDALQEVQYACGGFHLSNLNLRWTPDMLLHSMEANQIVHDLETEILYTHNNHLGSAAWITRNDGKPIQYIHYLPYGQLLANQMLYGYDERFKFIGKERDWESGYDYFGARYYISPFMHWLSVDPLSDNTPAISPYAYCRWNPLNRIDPDGNTDWKMVGKGAFVTACGVSSCIGGASLAASTVGYGAPLGALLLVDGYSSIGIGIAMLTTGILTDYSAKNAEHMNAMPTSTTNALAKSADIIAGTSNHEIEYVLNAGMLIVGKSSKLEGTADIFSKTMTALQAIELVHNIIPIEKMIGVSNNSIQENINVVDNTRVYIMEKPQPIPYNNQSELAQ